MNAVELEKITKTFGQHTAVDALDLVVPEGTVYGFIGPNGSGKTTTLRMILRILYPDRGVVRVLGNDHGDAADDRIGYLPEERGLYKRMRVRDVLRFHAELKGRRDCRRAIDEWLERMELTPWADKRVEALSKGMSQKVQFISAVIAEPELLILDEPFSGLDPVNMEVLKDVVLDLKRRGTTVIFSTHDMDVAERMCDHIFMIFRGQKVLDGTLQSIQNQYGEDTIRVRTEATNGVLEDLPGVVRVNDYGRNQELRIAPGTDSQAVLHELARRTRIEHFELARPRCTIFSCASPGRRNRLECPMNRQEGRPGPRERRPAMSKVSVIAKREYKALVRTKAFIISLLAMPLFTFGAIGLQLFLQKHVDTSDKKVVVLDGTGKLFGPLEIMARLRNEGIVDQATGRRRQPAIALEKGPDGPVTDDMRLALSDRIRKNEIFAFVEINADALKPGTDAAIVEMLRQVGLPTPPVSPKSNDVVAEKKSTAEKPSGESGDRTAPVRIYTESVAYNELNQWLVRAINQAAFALRLEAAGLNPAVVAGAVSPIWVDERGLYSKTTGGEIRKGDGGSRAVAFLLPMGIVMLMFMSVMAVCQPMLTSVLEEKQQRVAEVLLGSASPFQLMMGKLMGNVGVALTIVAVYLAGIYIVAAHYGYTDMLPTWLLLWFLAFEVLACLLYGAIFIAIGAACTEIKDAQSLLMPVMMMLVMPLMVWFNVVQEPLSKFAVWMSLFPPATPMLMLLRMGASPVVPMWQPVLGIVLVLAATVLCVFAAGRIFRIGLLMQGKAPRMIELVRWIAQG